MTQDELIRADKQRLEAARKEAEEALVARDDAQRRLDIANRALQAWQTIVESAATTDLGRQVEFTGNKTQWVRLLIGRHEREGITPQSIRKMARQQNIEVTPQFPYTIVHKLKEAEKIREDNGRYFPAVPKES